MTAQRPTLMQTLRVFPEGFIIPGRFGGLS